MPSNSGKLIPEFTKSDVDKTLSGWESFGDALAWVAVTVSGVVGLVLIIRGLWMIRSSPEGAPSNPMGGVSRGRGVLFVFVGGALIAVSAFASVLSGIFSF